MREPAFRPWREAWTEALYGERGFYRRREGPRGHFETSANAPGGEVAVLAEALTRLAAQHGARRVVDLGAGRGELASALVATTPPDVTVLAVDIVGRPPGLPAPVDWLRSPGGAELPAALGPLDAALVIAHEWLDVVPCDVLEVDDRGELRVVEVDRYGAERLGAPADASALLWCEQWWPLGDAAAGTRVEVGATRDQALARLLDHVHSGVVAVVDYGHTMAARPPRGSLAGHRDGRLVPPVVDGSCDITADVAWDSLVARSGGTLTGQRETLLGLGVDGRPPRDPRHASYLPELQRAAAAGTLLDPGGLGGLGWLVCPVPGPAGPTVEIGQAEPAPARLDR